MSLPSTGNISRHVSHPTHPLISSGWIASGILVVTEYLAADCLILVFAASASAQFPASQASLSPASSLLESSPLLEGPPCGSDSGLSTSHWCLSTQKALDFLPFVILYGDPALAPPTLV
ncbi:hypothetical protein MSAN_01993700 [Mycena sanguinolenta]|uniref:Uncharacterized protein n=1 Tax=Mycena sanguinolenta TaxID=230812 RepID=A0A8H6XKP1_9AGAR|nr:hypothetical protein MSAN_01993700 [Mycena sanguinolenta]